MSDVEEENKETNDEFAVEYGNEFVDNETRRIAFNDITFEKVGSPLDIKIELNKNESKLMISFTDNDSKRLFTNSYDWAAMRATNAVKDMLIPEDVYELLLEAFKDSNLIRDSMRAFHVDKHENHDPVTQKYKMMGQLPGAEEFSNEAYDNSKQPDDSLMLVVRFEKYKRYNLVFRLPQTPTKEIDRLNAKIEELSREVEALKKGQYLIPTEISLKKYLINGAQEQPEVPIMATRVGSIVFIFGHLKISSTKPVLVLPNELLPMRYTNISVGMKTSEMVKCGIIDADGKVYVWNNKIINGSYVSPLV